MSVRTYARSLRIVAQIEAVQGPLPVANTKRQPTTRGHPLIRPDTAKELKLSRGILVRAWLHVRAGREHSRLTADDVSQEQALHIAHLVRDLPEASRAAEVERLTNLPIAELKDLKTLKTLEPDPAPVTPRRSRAELRKPISQRWHELMVEIRRHLMHLDGKHLVEDLVRSWSPPVYAGYCQELNQVIASLQRIAERLDRAEPGPTPARVLRLDELSRPRTRQRG